MQTYNLCTPLLYAYDALSRVSGLGQRFGDGAYQNYAWDLDGDLTVIGHAYPGRLADDLTLAYADDRLGAAPTLRKCSI